MFRFIHTADLHLDSPLRSLALRDGALADLVGAASRESLRTIVDLCLEHRVNALLIAGDMLDGDLRSMKTAGFLRVQMERLQQADIVVFVIQGNHDAQSRLTRNLMLPQNVFVFPPGGATQLLEDHQVAIHGVSFANPHAPDSLLPKYPQPVQGFTNIGMLHTSLTGAAGHDPYAPCSLSELVEFGYDYWALGHIHKRKIHSENPFVVMPGMPQGRDIGESGIKSVTLASIGAEGLEIAQLDTSVAVFETLECDLSGLENWDDMLRAIYAAMRAHGVEQPQILRVILHGQTPLAWQVRRDLDILTGQLQERFEQNGNIWLDKVVCDLQSPQQAVTGSNAHLEMQALIGSLQNDPVLQAQAHEMAERLVAKLPKDLRNILGADDAARAGRVLALLEQGSNDIIARILAGGAE